MRVYARLALLLCVTAMAGCGERGTDSFYASDKHDRYQDLNREDYRNMDGPKGKKMDPAARPQHEPENLAAASDAPEIPDVADILAAPRPPKINQSKLVSIAVTDDVSIRDVLFELARLADVDIEIGNGIEGGINFRATNKPFNEVVERIADLAGLRYSMKGGVLRVERDTPFIKNYSLDFLNIVRSAESEVTLNTDVLASSGESGSNNNSGGSGNSGGGGSSSNNEDRGLRSGTTSTINATAESDLWTALDASVGEILNHSPAVSNASSTAAAATPNGSAGYVINRQAGVLSANATERQHDMITRFLDTMKRNVSAQVIIEAKIVEVTLDDQFRTGVNWDAVLERADINVNFQPVTAITATRGFTFGLPGGTAGPNRGLEDIVNITQEFGTTRTLSSPRLHAINNQTSVLTFAQNRIFFTCNQTGASGVSNSTGGTLETSAAFTCERGVVPIGILLSIMPSVNLDTQEITLNVRPSLSRQVSEVEDPGTRIAAAVNDIDDLSGAVPVVEVRELDSVMKIKNGGVMVIGGLLEDISTNGTAGIPGLSDIPWIGNAFKSRDEKTSKRELIIFIKASIVDSDGQYTPADKRAYEKFTKDPRPLGL